MREDLQKTRSPVHKYLSQRATPEKKTSLSYSSFLFLFITVVFLLKHLVKLTKS